MLCSDSGGSENHVNDYCVSPDGHLLDDQTGDNLYNYICEVEVSSYCLPGWAYYLDDGSEGRSSCVQLSSYTVSSYDEAVDACPRNAHLLTVSSTLPHSPLLTFVGSLYVGGVAYVGCVHDAQSADMNTGWSWVDETPSTALNCGGTGCGLWSQSEPL